MEASLSLAAAPVRQKTHWTERIAHVVLAGEAGLMLEDLADRVGAAIPKKAIDPALDFHRREGRIRNKRVLGERGRWCVTDEGRAVHERLMSAQVTA